MAAYYKSNSADYRAWLNSEAWVTGNQKATRREIMCWFADDLQKWVEMLGYKMSKNWVNNREKIVSQWVYGMSVFEVARKDYGHPLSYPEVEHRDWQEDLDYFHITFNCDEVDEFMNRWTEAEDFNDETRLGQRVKGELQKFVYCFLDLENCRNGKRVAKFLETSDNESDSEREHQTKKNNNDNYLEDAKEGFHGGRGQKV